MLSWFYATRPWSFVFIISPVSIGSLLAYKAGNFHWVAALVALLSALFIQIGTNLANDYYDFVKGVDSLDQKGPTNIIITGKIQPEKIKLAFRLAFLCASILGAYLIFRAGLPIIFIGILSLLAGYFYTGGPRPLGYVGLGDILVLIFFGPVAVAGTYYVNTLEFASLPVILGLTPGLLAAALLCANNIRDYENDKKHNKNTLVVRFGKTFGKVEYIFSLLIAITIPMFIAYQAKNTFLLLGLLFVLIICLSAIHKFLSAKLDEFNPILQKTGNIIILFTLVFLFFY
jgi:1,4-dihydroxy-2-naphthoate polyprenyltransferase